MPQSDPMAVERCGETFPAERRTLRASWTGGTRHAYPLIDPNRPAPVVHQGGQGGGAVLREDLPEVAHRPRLVDCLGQGRERGIPFVRATVLRDECGRTRS